MRAKRGFTLVEILIVVVILGILAAIVVPQFTQASTEAKENSLCSNLQSLRSQIELYKVQHNDSPPDNTPATFTEQMVYCTDVDGAINGAGSKVRTTTYCYGPYLERVPNNPFNNFATITAGTTIGAADDTTGWLYNTATGEIFANTTGANASSVDYADF